MSLVGNCITTVLGIHVINESALSKESSFVHTVVTKSKNIKI